LGVDIREAKEILLIFSGEELVCKETIVRNTISNPANNILNTLFTLHLAFFIKIKLKELIETY
jgi:hypothetical protein